MTIDELKSVCDDEFNNIDMILKELSSVYDAAKKDYSLAERASIAAFIINIYSGVENILKQMLVYDKLDVKDVPGWHELVLKKSSEIGILPSDLFQMLGRYLSFRNYFIYNYIFNIKDEDLMALAEAVSSLITNFRNEVDEYIQTI
jgi:uncharacterized protein YutE (UPF0331/DUF86 family)